MRRKDFNQLVKGLRQVHEYVRERDLIIEMESWSVDEVAQKVLNRINFYKDEHEGSFKLLVEQSLDAYAFWYAENPDRERELELLVYQSLNSN